MKKHKQNDSILWSYLYENDKIDSSLAYYIEDDIFWEINHNIYYNIYKYILCGHFYG